MLTYRWACASIVASANANANAWRVARAHFVDAAHVENVKVGVVGEALAAVIVSANPQAHSLTPSLSTPTNPFVGDGNAVRVARQAIEHHLGSGQRPSSHTPPRRAG